MDFIARYKELFQTSIRLLADPSKFWKEQREGEIVLEGAFKNFFLPLVVLVGVAVFVGEFISNSEFLLSYAVAKSIREMVSYVFIFFLSAYLLNELLKTFGGKKDKLAIARLMAYSLLPFLMASFVTGLFPALYMLNIVSLYGFFLFFWGVKECLDLPAENKTRYAMVGILLIIFVVFLMDVFSWKLLGVFYGA